MAHHGGGGGGAKKKSTKEDSMPYVVGSSVSGILEVLIFHPIDTIAKRLMSNTTTIFQNGAPRNENWERLNKVLFKKDIDKGFFGRWLSLFPGVSFGAVYKILQRTYKFGSQPLLTPIITDHYGWWFDQTFGKNSKDMQNAVSGALVGMGEVVLLPLDVLKIKSQTNPDVLKGRGLVELFVKENVRLYRGTTWSLSASLLHSSSMASNDTATSSQATLLLQKQLKDLCKKPVDGFSAGLVDESNIFEWSVTIIGPPDTLYDGGFFNARMTFPNDYPVNPPTVQFTSQVWHPNVYPDGKVCISILHPPGEDPNGYETAIERWNPVHTVESIVLSIISMLSSPNDESPANVDAAKMWRERKDEFRKTVTKCVRKSQEA